MVRAVYRCRPSCLVLLSPQSCNILSDTIIKISVTRSLNTSRPHQIPEISYAYIDKIVTKNCIKVSKVAYNSSPTLSASHKESLTYRVPGLGEWWGGVWRDGYQKMVVFFTFSLLRLTNWYLDTSCLIFSLSSIKIHTSSLIINLATGTNNQQLWSHPGLSSPFSSPISMVWWLLYSKGSSGLILFPDQIHSGWGELVCDAERERERERERDGGEDIQIKAWRLMCW